MKKILIAIAILLMPVIVFGQTCDTNRDPATGNTRNITCDAENSVVYTILGIYDGISDYNVGQVKLLCDGASSSAIKCNIIQMFGGKL